MPASCWLEDLRSLEYAQGVLRRVGVLRSKQQLLSVLDSCNLVRDYVKLIIFFSTWRVSLIGADDTKYSARYAILMLICRAWLAQHVHTFATTDERRCHAALPYELGADLLLQVLKPGRLTLLLGPPGSGKSTLLKAIGGKLSNTSLQARQPRGRTNMLWPMVILRAVRWLELCVSRRQQVTCSAVRVSPMFKPSCGLVVSLMCLDCHHFAKALHPAHAGSAGHRRHHVQWVRLQRVRGGAHRGVRGPEQQPHRGDDRPGDARLRGAGAGRRPRCVSLGFHLKP